MMGNRSDSAKKAWATRRSPTYKASKSEQASKQALREWCQINGWKILFFEGKTGSPRTGIVDAILTRIRPNDADTIEIKFVQLKSGGSGFTGSEAARLKRAIEKASVDWLAVLFDGEMLHFVPDTPRLQALLDKSRQSLQAGKGLSHTEFWKAVKPRDGKRVNRKAGSKHGAG
jgi:hypothetical protein